MKTIRIIDSQKEINVGKILCLGKNYTEHAKEMQSDVPTTPVIFLKPSSAIIQNGESIIRPKISKELHHEVELVIVIGDGGKNITANEAYNHILGYAIGLDMTLRDIQSNAKKQGHPWAIAKGFDTSAPVSDVIPANKIPSPNNITITCSVNGVLRQKSSTSKMIFCVEKIIEYVSSIFTLELGDLIFTGTPEGVGEVKPGDTIEAELVDYIKITHPVVGA